MSSLWYKGPQRKKPLKLNFLAMNSRHVTDLETLNVLIVLLCLILYKRDTNLTFGRQNSGIIAVSKSIVNASPPCKVTITTSKPISDFLGSLIDEIL